MQSIQLRDEVKLEANDMANFQLQSAAASMKNFIRIEYVFGLNSINER